MKRVVPPTRLPPKLCRLGVTYAKGKRMSISDAAYGKINTNRRTIALRMLHLARVRNSSDVMGLVRPRTTMPAGCPRALFRSYYHRRLPEQEEPLSLDKDTGL
jgi:hypothetical protein